MQNRYKNAHSCHCRPCPYSLNDHTEGIVFIERLPNIKKVLLKRKLKDISNGKIDPGYKMILPRKKVKSNKQIKK